MGLVEKKFLGSSGQLGGGSPFAPSPRFRRAQSFRSYYSAGPARELLHRSGSGARCCAKNITTSVSSTKIKEVWVWWDVKKVEIGWEHE